MRIAEKVLKNSMLENQGIEIQEQLEDAIDDLLNGALSRIWDEE